jgi:hypothetical protein
LVLSVSTLLFLLLLPYFGSLGFGLALAVKFQLLYTVALCLKALGLTFSCFLLFSFKFPLTLEFTSCGLSSCLAHSLMHRFELGASGDLMLVEPFIITLEKG